MKTNSKIWIGAAAGALALLFLHRRKTEAVGKVERVKRRIYKEVSLAQKAGVDFSKKFADLATYEREALEHIGKDIIGWKQSKRSVESGKPYVESYYGSLRRAWNAVSGVQGIGRTYDVKDANGNVCLTWIDTATEHIEHEPDQHVLLALPPHVEAKKKKAKRSKVSEEEYAEREAFAREFLEEFEKKYVGRDSGFHKKLFKQHYKGDWDINDVPDNIYDGLIVSFARNELKIKSNNIWFCGEKFSLNGGAHVIQNVAEDLLEAWNNREIEQGFEREDLDDLRRALLDRAKLMQVVINPYKEYEDKTRKVTRYDYNYDRNINVIVPEFGDIVSGDDRYNYMDKINYVVWVSKRASDYGGMTFYPIRSYPDYEGAEHFIINRYKTGAKVLPIWEVPIEKITGLK